MGFLTFIFSSFYFHYTLLLFIIYCSFSKNGGNQTQFQVKVVLEVQNYLSGGISVLELAQRSFYITYTQREREGEGLQITSIFPFYLPPFFRMLKEISSDQVISVGYMLVNTTKYGDAVAYFTCVLEVFILWFMYIYWNFILFKLLYFLVMI